MSRNYVEFYSARVNQGGNYVSFIDDTAQKVTDQANAYIATFGGTLDWQGSRGYFLINKSNVVGVLKTLAVHYPTLLGSAWIFFQSGVARANESPRETWSHGE